MITRLAHGTRYRYQKGCRCELCKVAQARYNRAWARQALQKDRCMPGLGWPLGDGDIAPRKRRATPQA